MTRITRRTLQFYFKVVYTTNSQLLNIDGSMTMTDLIIYLNKPCMKNMFNINECAQVEIVVAGNTIYGDAEYAPKIEDSDETMSDNFNPQTTSFYIRPIY